MSCDPVIPPDEPVNPEHLRVAPATTLVTDPATPQVRTACRETDVLGALRRGLAEYLRGASLVVAGAPVTFVDVLEQWAEPEDTAAYPSAAVLIDGEAEFDASSFTPSVGTDDVLPDGRFVVKQAEVTVTLRAVAYCATPAQRSAVAMLLEDVLNPVDWMHGFRLDLPHYYGARGEYEVTMADYVDDAQSARRGVRPLEIQLAARISQLALRGLPLFSPKLDVSVDDVDDSGAEPG